jgi:hydrogenase maturation protein HypF
MTALEILLEGRIQGVGFRPFVWNLAKTHDIAGWVANTAQGVTVHAEAPLAALRNFSDAIQRDLPSPARIHASKELVVPALDCADFFIRDSDPSGEHLGSIHPDLGLCEACKRELLDRQDRRHLHAFISCTYCGPRFSIVEGLPYDRSSTSMREFPMCPECRAEYEDPTNRRFHAQPVCCPQCGPRMWCETPTDQLDAGWGKSEDDWLTLWVKTIEDGGIALVKGIGGFHLACDATNPNALRRLRQHKRRETKPFALMVPNLEMVRAMCKVTPAEESLLTDAERPIVLLDVHTPPKGMEWIAPGLSQLGIMLPHAPLHEIFFSRIAKPLVLTSANRSHEPMLTKNEEARSITPDWCDLLVLHDRPIVNRVDDGVAAVVPESGQTVSLRIGRGGSPREFSWSDAKNCLATGADLKNALALSHHGRVTLSQHIGDMDHPITQAVARETAQRLCDSYRTTPAMVACDAHPDFASSHLASQLARTWNVPIVRVQHHHAHVAAAWLEHQWEGDAIGFAMDGTGYGDSDCIWGSEAMHYTSGGSTTLGYFQGMRLPGGDLAVREPMRLLIGALHDLGDPNMLDAWMDRHPDHLSIYDLGLKAMLDADLNCPSSRGMGRLFDLVGAMLGWPHPGWDGETGTRLEHLDTQTDAPPWPVELASNQILLGPLLGSALRDILNGKSPRWIASRLHATVCEIVVKLGLHAEEQLDARDQRPLPWAFAGGVFQNRKLVARLHGHPVVKSRQTFLSSIPNDNGIALGQIVAATAHAKEVLPCA